MAIILILAGLILSIAGHVQTKASISRATAEIQAFSTAIGNYQIDNGAYPRVTKAVSSTANTDFLDARDNPTVPVNSDPATTSTPNYSTTSQILYRLLSGAYYYDSTSSSGLTQWSTSSPVSKPTTYYNFNNSQLKYNNLSTDAGNPTLVLAIVDPFGFSYGYSTIYQADLDANNAASPPVTTPPTNGFNPTYDLWSTAGFSNSGGKAYPSGVPTPAPYNSVWVKNW